MSDSQSGPAAAPPFDEGAEQAVVGAVLVDPAALGDIGNALEADDFYRESHRAIYRAMLALEAARQPIDVVLVAKKLKEHEALEVAGGTPYLTQLSSRVPTTVNVKHHAAIVKEKAKLRTVIGFAREVAHTAGTELEDVSRFVDDLAQRALQLSTSGVDRSVSTVAAAMREAVDRMEKISKQKRAGGVTGVTSGFRDLDRQTSGWQPSDLIVLAARPGMGKTAFALNMLQNAATHKAHPAPGVIFSLEMSKEQLATRLLAAKARVPIEQLRSANVEDWTRVYENVSSFKQTPIFIDDTPALPIAEMMRKCRQLKHEHDIGIIFVDYLQLMTASAAAQRGGREQQISEISRNLKALAKELHVPVIALSQLNRAVEARPDKRPMLSDLRESGAIEQDADLIVFLYREQYYASMKGDQGDEQEASGGYGPQDDLTEVIIAKHRSGATGRVTLQFHGPYTLFSNATPEEPPPPDDSYFNAKRDNPTVYPMGVDAPAPAELGPVPGEAAVPENAPVDPFDPFSPI
ncbi:MAG: replicative DNA helicase [Bradymonadia bacterium]|jgi:replicative DNA helicase